MKQKFHLEAPHGLMNDPNGLCEFRRIYHVFFQWNPNEKNHSYKCWGHFTSKDFIHWQFLGKAIEPSESYDRCGTYSGSACVIDDKFCLFYTGNNKIDGARKSSQCIAESSDGKNFQKLGTIFETPKDFTEHFRDPKISFDGKNFKMIIGAQKKSGTGAIVQVDSTDGKNFQNLQILGESQNFEMIECPDLIDFGTKKILLYGLQKRDNRIDKDISAESFYKIFNDSSLDNCRRIDSGFDFYAPQTFETSDGRKILFAWMSRLSESQEKFLADRAENIHCLTMPREIFLNGDKLYQKPVREMYKMLGDQINSKMIPRSFYCKLEKNFARGFEIDFSDELKIVWTGQIFKFLRKDFSGLWQEKICELERLFEVEIWSDESSIEIFLNGGEFVLTARTFFDNDFEVTSDEELKIFSINANDFFEDIKGEI